MSQDRYDVLITRIRTHCQQTIQEALHLAPDAFERVGPTPTTSYITFGRPEWAGHARWAEDYVGWYLHERKSFLALRKDSAGQVSFAFPPATEQQIMQTEQQLGFPLPPLLRLLYMQLTNGGFGPGYGITGAIGGYPFGDISLWGTIALAYQQAVEEANDHRQRFIQLLLAADQEEREAKQRSEKLPSKVGPRLGPDGKVTPEWEESLPPLWPEHCLPLCQWGCNISTYIDAEGGEIFQGMSGPDLFVAASLEEWLERWLAGENLQLM